MIANAPTPEPGSNRSHLDKIGDFRTTSPKLPRQDVPTLSKTFQNCPPPSGDSPVHNGQSSIRRRRKKLPRSTRAPAPAVPQEPNAAKHYRTGPNKPERAEQRFASQDSRSAITGVHNEFRLNSPNALLVRTATERSKPGCIAVARLTG